MKIILFIAFIGSQLSMLAQPYSVAFIPDSLLKQANVVTRYAEQIFEIKSPGKAIKRNRTVTTILNRSGDSYATFGTYYDRFIDINSISGTLYNAFGKELKNVKKKDIKDFSGTSEISLLEDTRYKVHNFYCHDYPYTVEYEEVDEVDGFLYILPWVPQELNYTSVQWSKYVVIAPKDYDVRYKSINCNLAPVITTAGDKKIYTWEIKNLPARGPEALAPSWQQLIPYVIFGPSELEAEGYKGNMNTWENYGKFIYQLIKGRDELPEDLKKKLHVLTDNIQSVEQKINAVYDFLQNNTRYISIQLGIGGWQPFPAREVASKGYGDCKALSNFMIAMLKEVGITANYVQIRAGENEPPMIEDFPSLQSNHVTCCVPMGTDTMWLECTSNTKPAGYTGAWTGNRKAILIDEKGAHIVRTPSYSAKDNVQTRKIVATINEDGSLTANIETKYKAERQDDLNDYINSLSKDKMMEFLKSEINLPTYDIARYEYKQEKKIKPSIEESLELTSSNYAQVSGKRLFLNPNLMTRTTVNLKPNDSRKYDIELRTAQMDIDSIEISIPKGYEREAVPDDIKLESKFGKYATQTKILEGKIIYYRYFEQERNRYPATDYGEMVRFYEKINKADQNKIVLVRKEAIKKAF